MEHYLPALAAGITAFLLLELVRGSVRKTRGRWRAQRRARLYLRAEADAEILLERRGYRILDRQVSAEFAVQCGSDRTELALRADLLVSRKRRTFIAEVKSGEFAPSITNAATRRQLREYLHVYPVDGVLLVHPESGEVREVVFEVGRNAGNRKPLWLGAIVAAFGVAAYLLGTW